MNKIAHIHLEGPLIKAAKALIPEKPLSLGWHANFPWKRWAFVFEGNPSRRAIEAAHKTGLDFQKDLKSNPVLTAITIPNIKESEVEEATRIFDAFADEYKSVSKKVASIITHYVNEGSQVIRKITAEYDREKLKPGYKGRFVIQEHDAERAGKHWDFRIEFPVTSLGSSLKKYDSARPDSNEPSGSAPDKTGTVYRSFVDRKRELPTKDDKIYLIETEDHPIEYGKFEGTIEKGYGAGTVKIWDKGTYELLDAEGDKKFTLNFDGKKLKGVYALIKYQKGYLWIKSHKKKEASAIDYIRPTLPPQLWDLDTKPPTLRDKIRNAVIGAILDAFEKAGLERPLRCIKGLFISGSGAGYNYKEDGDLDIDILYEPKTVRNTYPELDKLTDTDLFEYLKKVIGPKNGKKIAGTSHTFSYMVLKSREKPIGDGVYDVLKNKWVKEPTPIPMDFDPDRAFIKQRLIAETIAQKIDLLIGEIIRTIDDLRKIDQFRKFYGNINEKHVIVMHHLQELCKNLDDWYNWIWNLQKKAARGNSKAVYPTFNYSPNWKEKMIIFKYLARYGYHRCVSMLYSLLKDDPYLDVIDQFIPD